MPIAFDPEGDKVTRMHAQSAQIESGCVFLPRFTSWLGDFQAELLQFPHGRHDDQVDSMSQFLAWIRKRSAASFFRCDWIDPRPTIEELFGQSLPASGLPLAASALNPNMRVAVRQSDGRAIYMSPADYAAKDKK